ncbi:hypothetical protein LTR17_002340 [Elasticomyces elasticus]|nr:hypothetical protein LTR17_002340 [Elasticomyces elasticus]
MHAFTIAAASFAALASAVPHAGHSHRHAHKAPALAPRDDSTFDLTVHNNCTGAKSFGLYQVSPAFEMVEMSDPISLEPGESACINAPFSALGMRLSGTADKGCDGQWSAQTLFEFGYSEYNGMTGTAYDLSVMEGSVLEGIAAYPATPLCESKVCSATGCSLAQAWTQPEQEGEGSPADTVCYHGKQAFDVVWCPQ